MAGSPSSEESQRCWVSSLRASCSCYLRGQQPSFILTLLAALSFLGMLALFAFGNNPLNQQIATWTPETLPANWQQVRDAWDRFHVISSVLAALAFTVLLVDLLRQMPSSWQQKHGRRSASAQAQ